MLSCLVSVLCNDSGVNDLSAYVLYDGETMEQQVVEKGEGRFEVSFRGTEVGRYTTAVYSGGVEVAGSPIEVMCKDVGTVKVTGEGLHKAEIGRDANFQVDYSESGFGHVTVRLTAPNGDEVLAPVRVKDTGIVEVTYNPPIPGKSLNIVH